jgi:hypothetical protein
MRITKRTHPELWKMDHGLPVYKRVFGFSVDQEKYNDFLKEADRAVPHLSSAEKEAWAAHAARTHKGQHRETHGREHRRHLRISLTIAVMILLILTSVLLILILAQPAKAEPNEFHRRYSRAQMYEIFAMPQGITEIKKFQFDASNNLKVNCLLGCSASAGFTDNSAFTVSTSTITVTGAYFTSGADPTCTTGNACRMRVDASSNLKINCAVGCSGSSFADNTAFTAGTTPIAISGGWFSNAPTACTSGNACSPSMTSDRKMFVQDFQGTSPWVDSITTWGGGTLGAMANYGSTPGAVLVPGVNAFITNTPTVTANAGTNLNTSALALDTSVNGLLLSQGSTTSGQKGPLAQGAVTTSAPSYTTAQTSPLSLNTSGGLRVDGSGVTQPVSGTVTANAGTGQFNVTCTAANCPVNVAQFGGTNVVTGTGASGVGIPRVTISNDSSILGTKTNNNAAPGATNFGDLPAIANAATQSWTEGNQVALSVDLSGQQRIRGTLSDNGAASTSNRIAGVNGIYQTDYNNGSAGTQGRDSAQNQGTDGLLWVAPLPAMRPASYHASAIVASAATATDIASMPGNASNTVLVTGIRVSCTQTTGSIINLSILMRTTADSAGTPVTTTIHKGDSNYTAASSAPKTWTGNPTKGTLEAMVDAVKLGCMAPGTVSPNDIYISPSNWRMKPMVLRGTAQELEVNLGAPIDGAGTTVTGSSFLITFEWIETKTITP